MATFFKKVLGPFLVISQSAVDRAMDRVNNSTPIEEDGFKLYSLPTKPQEERQLFRRPEALQFHFRGKLFKVTGERASGIFELFLDLLYVATLALFAKDVAEHPDGLHIAKFMIIFFHAYQIWNYLREIFDNYYTDDILQRALVLFCMCCLIVFANNASKIGSHEDHDDASYYTAVGSYLLVHGVLIIFWFFTSLFIAEHFVRMRILGIFNICSFALRCGLLGAKSWQLRAGLACAALGVELFFWIYIYSPMFEKHHKSEFSTAVNIEHTSDRMTAIYIIVLGEFLNSAILQAPAAFGMHKSTGKAILSCIIAFCLNWLYVHNDGSIINTHAIRRSVYSAIGYLYIHEPLCAALVLSGDIATEFILEEHLHYHSLYWIFCGGIAVGVFCLWMLAQCTLGRQEMKWPKQVRLAMRIVDTIVFVCLPLSHLETLYIMLIIALMLIFTVIWESYGSLPKNTTFEAQLDLIHRGTKVDGGESGFGQKEIVNGPTGAGNNGDIPETRYSKQGVLLHINERPATAKDFLPRDDDEKITQM